MKIYIGQTPEPAPARRALRERALALRNALHEHDTIYLLLNARLRDGTLADMVIITDAALLVGQYVGLPPTLSEQQTQLEHLRHAREQANMMLRHALPERAHQAHDFAGTIGALLFERPLAEYVALDVDDHRQHLKMTLVDELPALVRIARTGITWSEHDARTIAGGILGGRPWHDGEQFLFELAHAAYHLRVLDGEQVERVLPLLEGTNIIGRRRTPIQSEYRLSVSGDGSMSNDHALILCPPDGRVILRDTSTNGTWVTRPGEAEERISRIERTIAPGTILRMGETRLVLERANRAEV